MRITWVSGRVHLEPRKTNVRRAGERVWYAPQVMLFFQPEYKFTLSYFQNFLLGIGRG